VLAGFEEAEAISALAKRFPDDTIQVALFIRLALISQRRRVAVTDKEQVAQHFDFAPLLTVAKPTGIVFVMKRR
jgi:hypothetical protein